MFFRVMPFVWSFVLDLAALPMMNQVGDNLDVLKYFTLNTLFDTKSIVNGSGYGLGFELTPETWTGG
jgi:hypothetical protein